MSIINLMHEKLVDNYINGKGRISNKKLEELENNPSFMMCAINKSNDSKLYRLCSHEVKMNYNFLRFYIDKFKDNIEVIDTAATYFLGKSNDQFLNFELCVLMKNLTIDQNEEYCKKYGLEVEKISLIDDCIIEVMINDIKDTHYRELFGLGFMYLEDLYNFSDLIKDHYAKRMILNLFDKNKNSIESDIHTKFKTSQDFINYGINKYFIDYLIGYDQALAAYIQLKPELLNLLKYRLENMLNRWEQYNKSLANLRYSQIIRIYNEYMNSLKYSYDDSYYDLLKYIIKNLGISNDIYDIENDLAEEDFDEILGIKKPINIFNFGGQGIIKLQETIASIQSATDPEVIRNTHFVKEECVVTRLKSKAAKVTQL